MATHPRSGTHLLLDALRWRSADCRVWKLPFERLERLYITGEELVTDSRSASNLGVLSTLLRARRPLIKTHRLPGFQRWFMPPRHEPLSEAHQEWIDRQGSFVHVHRDGREAVWSYFLLARRSGALEGMTFSEFLRRPSIASPWHSAARGWALHVRAWLGDRKTLSLSFSELLEAPEASLRCVARHAGLTLESRSSPLPPRLRTVHDYHVARGGGGHPPSTAVLAPDPILPPRGWRDVFSADDGRVFERETGGLLVELGYADSHTWWQDLP